MSTIQIADKPTLDNINSTTSSTATTVDTISTNIATAKADTTVLKTRGGIKSDGTDLYGYNPTTSAWDKVSIGGGSGGSTLVIKNENSSLTGKSITITHESGVFTRTITGTNDNYYRVDVPYAGKYIITSGVKIASIEVADNGNTMIVMNPLVPAFSTATWAEISSICNAYYNGDITDLSEYWSIGDTKSIDIAAMSATGVSESHNAQRREICIIDFAHDNLTTAIDGTTKAAITLELVDCMNTKGYLNSSDSNYGGWSNSQRRTWCNNVFYNALPSDLKDIIKPVNKLTSAGYQSSTINTDSDKCWLPSEIEILGTTSNSKPGEGSQYLYYQTIANRIKKVNNSIGTYWLRSPYKSSTAYFIFFNSSTSTASYDNPTGTKGLAPALCI